MESQKKLYPTVILSTLLAMYLIVRFLCTQWLDSLGGYTTYYFEIFLVLVSCVLLRDKLKRMFNLSSSLYPIVAGALIAGYLAFKGTALLDVTVPFDLSNNELRFFLLVVAPVLEEFIFRFFCWQPFERINKRMALAATSVLFSYSHFHSFWFVPSEYQGFVFYQTGYTLVLGLACGYSIWKYNSLFGAILIHFTFNLGFFLSSTI